MERLNQHGDDALSKLLRVVNVHSSVYCVSDFRAPWGFRVEDSAAAKFHVPLEGRGVLELDDGERLSLEAGTLVVLPFGTGHTVRDRSRSGEVPRFDQLLAEAGPKVHGRLRAGGRGRRTRLICGGFALAEILPARLISTLPRIVTLDPTADGSGASVAGLLDLFRAAAEDTAPGASAVMAKIADVLLTQALRSYLLRAERAGRVQLGPLQQPAIARAIELMRNRPAEPWTVAGLAHEVGMSRSLFVARFRALVGQPPMRFLTRVRLGQAAGSLGTSSATLHAVARQAGYETEASFSKAFKREFGIAPGAYRRQSVDRPVTVEWESTATDA